MLRLVLLVTSLLLFHVSAFAEMRVDKRLDFKSIKRIISLEEMDSQPMAQAATIGRSGGKNGYIAEFEKGLSGRLAGYQDADIGISVGIGVGFEAGAFILGRKQVATKSEANKFLEGDYQKIIKAERFDEWEKGEKYSFLLEGALILDPCVEIFGIWTVIKGSWSIEVEKISVSKINVVVTLMNTNTASFYVDALWNMISIDVGNSLSKGLTFEMDLDTKEGRKAYNQLFYGNLKTAQEYAKKLTGVEQLSEQKSKGFFSGSSLYSRSPLTAWYLLTYDFRIEEFESNKVDLKEKKTEQEFSANYVQDHTLKLFKYYHAKLRQFSSSFNKESEQLKLSDEWDEEYNRASSDQLRMAYASLLQQTKIDQLPKLNIPKDAQKGYLHLRFNYTYSNDFISYLIYNDIDFKKIAKISADELSKDREPFTKYYAMGTGSYMATETSFEMMLISKAADTISKLVRELKNSRTDEIDQQKLKIMAKIAKQAYSNPYLYKNWLKLAMVCGGQLDLEIEGENIKRLVRSQQFEQASECQF